MSTNPIPASQDANGSVPALALLEGVLFVAGGPLPIGRLAQLLDLPPREVERLLQLLQEQYTRRGLDVQWSAQGVQLTTAPEAAAVVERYLGLETTTRLSQAALEVLALVAYLQPVTRPQIDQVRGVNSDGALRTLLTHGLIEEVGRQETPGRPILYVTTGEFLQLFGLSSLAALPPLPEA